MWQIDENDGNEFLNLSMIKRVSGEDSISCRALYGHVVEIPPRAKLNFGVNRPPKLPPAKDLVEQFSLLRRFVYIDCAMNFLVGIDVFACERAWAFLRVGWTRRREGRGG